MMLRRNGRFHQRDHLIKTTHAGKIQNRQSKGCHRFPYIRSSACLKQKLHHISMPVPDGIMERLKFTDFIIYLNQSEFCLNKSLDDLRVACFTGGDYQRLLRKMVVLRWRLFV